MKAIIPHRPDHDQFIDAEYSIIPSSDEGQRRVARTRKPRSDLVPRKSHSLLERTWRRLTDAQGAVIAAVIAATSSCIITLALSGEPKPDNEPLLRLITLLERALLKEQAPGGLDLPQWSPGTGVSQREDTLPEADSG